MRVVHPTWRDALTTVLVLALAVVVIKQVQLNNDHARLLDDLCRVGQNYTRVSNDRAALARQKYDIDIDYLTGAGEGRMQSARVEGNTVQGRIDLRLGAHWVNDLAPQVKLLRDRIHGIKVPLC